MLKCQRWINVEISPFKNDSQQDKVRRIVAFQEKRVFLNTNWTSREKKNFQQQRARTVVFVCEMWCWWGWGCRGVLQPFISSTTTDLLRCILEKFWEKQNTSSSIKACFFQTLSNVKAYLPQIILRRRVFSRTPSHSHLSGLFWSSFYSSKFCQCKTQVHMSKISEIINFDGI